MSAPRSEVLVLVHAGAAQAITFAARPSLSYGVLDAGGGVSLVGIVAAAFALPALVLALPLGQATDRLGVRPGLIGGAILLTLAILLAGLSVGSITLLLGATVLMGIAQVGAVVAGQACLAYTVRSDRIVKVSGWYGFAASFGQTVGPLLLLLPSERRGVPNVSLVLFICGGIAFLMVLLAFLIPRSIAKPSRMRRSITSSTGHLISIRGIKSALLVNAFVLASIDIFTAYSPVIASDQGIPAKVVSFMLFGRSVMSMLSRLLLSRMICLFGRRNLLMACVSFSGLIVVALGLVSAASCLIILACVFGFLIGVCQPITMAWVAELAPQNTKGLAMSLRIASNRAAQTVLPAVLGLVFGGIGGGAVLGATGAVLAFASSFSKVIGRDS